MKRLSLAEANSLLPRKPMAKTISNADLLAADLLRFLGLPELMTRFATGEDIADTDRAIVDLHCASIIYYRQLNTFLGVSPGDSPINTLRTLLKAVGWRLERAGRIKARTGGDRDVCTYTAQRVALPEGASWEALSAKWMAELQSLVKP